MKKLIFVSLLFISLFSCKKEQENVVNVSNVQVNFSIDRFDVAFYTANTDSLFKVKEKYPLFFPATTPDSIWIGKIKSKDEQELFAESQKVYANISFLKEELTDLFKHIKYYNPNFKSPKVVTVLSNIDYDNRILYTGDYLLISLDVYLGENHEFYADYPKYIKQNFNKNHIIVDVTKAIINQYKPINNRTFLGKMINEGKKLFLLDVYLPKVFGYEKIGYSKEKYIWAEENEEQVWKYFIENKLLFSTDTKLNKRFLDIAPFSKFYRSEDNNSPGRIGVWMGWQIVKSFMKNNDVSLQELMKLPEEEIYNKSKYKPKR